MLNTNCAVLQIVCASAHGLCMLQNDQKDGKKHYFQFTGGNRKWHFLMSYKALVALREGVALEKPREN